jgi:peptidoglycan/LPS O-acetylase OafA/YrhL
MSPVLYFTIAAAFFVLLSAIIFSFDELDAGEKFGGSLVACALSVFWIATLPVFGLMGTSYALSRFIIKKMGKKK